MVWIQLNKTIRKGLGEAFPYRFKNCNNENCTNPAKFFINQHHSLIFSLLLNLLGKNNSFRQKFQLDKEKRVSKVFIALGTIFYIMVGFIIFIFLPAIVFTQIENWTYLEGVYYAFITLTTIGFGDFVSG